MKRSAWIAGLTVGAFGGALALEVPIAGWVLIAAFLVGALRSRGRVAAIAGLLTGIGAIWIAVFSINHVECRAFKGPGQQCSEPDIAPWITAGVAMLVVGIALTVVAIVHRRTPS